MKKLKICMYGAASDKIDPYFLEQGEALGRTIAEHGHSLVYGGGASGMMGACARGASAGKGKVIGVVPYFMKDFEGVYQDCTKLIQTKTMAGRKEIMEQKANAFVIVPGGVGTMDEFFQILTLTELNRKSSPIIVFNINGFYDSIFDFIDMGIEKGFIRKKVRDIFVVKSTPEEVVCAIEEAYAK